MTSPLASNEPSRAPEPDRVRGPAIFLVYALGVTVGMGGVGVSAWLLASDRSARGESTSMRSSATRPSPRTVGGFEMTSIEQTAVGLELAGRKRRELDTYGWVDRKAGIARIPIERAIEIVADDASRR